MNPFRPLVITGCLVALWVGLASELAAQEPVGKPNTEQPLADFVLPERNPNPAGPGVGPVPAVRDRWDPDPLPAQADPLLNPSNPRLLDRNIGPDQPIPGEPPPPTFTGTLIDPPLGFTGRSGIRPSVAANIDYVPVEDRWRIGFPEWDRYDRGHPLMDQYPYILGRWFDPYAQNVLKGDYPIIGQQTFFELTVSTLSFMEGRQIPTATTPFESTARPFQEEFFGRPNQFFSNNFLLISGDLFHGTQAFKPVDWRFRVTGVINGNYLSVEELAVVSPDVSKGLTRGRPWFALQEFFGEVKLADLSSEYDFVSVRAGSQPFMSDFRGFIYSDVNMMGRVFGTRRGNREQFNIVYTEQFEKETNSGLNTFDDRHQNVFIANHYLQDFLVPGFTLNTSVHYNDDQPSVRYDRNKFLVRPDPAGVFQPHRVQTVYLGSAMDGHIGRYNISNAFYWVVGHDSMNPIANQAVDISAQMAALEVSYDRDWARFRTSFFYASGDGDPSNSRATGFDAILPNPNFAGGIFSYWQRQGVPLFGVNLGTRNNLLPNLRSSPIQGQANHVNPGLFLVNGGLDLELTPKLRMVNNASFLWFDKTQVLEQFTFQPKIDREIGTDLSSGFEYRPLLNNNIIMIFGAAAFVPASGFNNIYDKFQGSNAPLAAAFVELNFTY